MTGRLKGLALWMTVGFVAVLITGTMVTRNLATEGTYTHLRLFNDVLSLIRNSYVDEPKTDSLMKGAYEGLMTQLDPFSEYLTPEEYTELSANLANASRVPGPAGASGRANTGLRLIKKEGIVMVVSVMPGSDAQTKGVTPGDQLRRIGDASTREMSLFHIESALSGAPGTKVTVSFARREEPRKLDTELTLRLPAGGAATFEVVDPKDGIAVMRVTHFNPGAAGEVAAILDRAASQRIKRLLIDLRGNAWGTVEEAAKTAGLFVGDIVIAHLDTREGRVGDLKTGRARASWPGQVVILTDGSTAEAAEVFSAALHEGRGAPVVGEVSFGIGAQQDLIPLRNGGGIRLSVRKYVSSSGTSWHGVGLKPDKVISVTKEGLKFPERQKEQLKQAIEYVRTAPASAPPVAALSPAAPNEAVSSATGSH